MRKTTGFTPAGDPLAITLTMPVITGLVDAKLAGTFTTNYGYNYDGTVSRMTTSAFGNLPAETLTYGYDAIGRPTGMVGNSSYLGDVVYSALGQVKQTAQQNTNNQTVWFTSIFDQATGRVTNSLLDRQLQPQADADVSYTYDQSGNLTGLSSLDKVAAGAQRDTQCFSRDHLGRLTQAWTTTTTSCGAATFAGPAPYRLSWSYDSSNNRTSETSYTSATVSASTAWSFPSAGSAKPNQVSQVAVTPAGATTPISTSYTYDAAGNTTARWTGNAITTGGTFTKATMAYDNEGKLASTTIGSQTISYYYSATGDRLIRKNGNTTTLYLDAVELTQTTAGGTPNAIRQYTALGKTVATRSGANNADIAWVFSDLNNTGGWQINSVSSAVTTRRTTPFGANRGAAASWRGSQGFVGGTIDRDAGFTHLGARDYDTFAGRFLTPDPVLDPNRPLEWNPYQYGIWDPIGNPDPTGLQPHAPCLETCNTFMSLPGGPRKVNVDTYDQKHGYQPTRKLPLVVQHVEPEDVQYAEPSSAQRLWGYIKVMALASPRGPQAMAYAGLAAVVEHSMNVSTSFSGNIGDWFIALLGTPEEQEDAVLALFKKFGDESWQQAQEDAVSSGNRGAAGVRAHNIFAQKIKAYNGPFNIESEVSFLNGKRVDYGTKGSSRADGTYINTDGQTTLLVDLKTGNAKITKQQATRYYQNGPKDYEWRLFEINPGKEPLYVAEP